jgi:hypothetical protein
MRGCGVIRETVVPIAWLVLALFIVFGAAGLQVVINL